MMQLKYRGLPYHLTAQSITTIDTEISNSYQRLEFPTAKLKYRGVAYQSQSQSIAMASTGVFAKYRGATYQIQRPTQTYVSRVTVNC
jgi:hypothetical protein